MGTIMSGRLGVTDAELMEKAFAPVFNAEDLHKQGNYQAIATVMMHNIPSAPFTMKLLPPMGEANPELMDTMKVFLATKFGRTRAEVEHEIQERWRTAEKSKSAVSAPESTNSKSESGSFLDNWRKKRAEIATARAEAVPEMVDEQETEVLSAAPGADGEAGSAGAKAQADEAVFKVKR